jgi:hypothetical protein
MIYSHSNIRIYGIISSFYDIYEEDQVPLPDLLLLVYILYILACKPFICDN